MGRIAGHFLTFFCNTDGTISTSVYLKLTHTGKYLNFDSHHPLTHKVAVIRTVVSRASALCSSGLFTQTELDHNG